MQETTFGRENDEAFMEEALKEAEKAFHKDEVPIGAVVVNPEGKIVARAHNSVEHDCTQRSHAESLALQKASQLQGDWRLDNYWLYTTLEPCVMCMGLITLSRLAGVVYGAASPLFGFHLDNGNDLRVYKKNAFLVIESVKGEQAALLLKEFFRKKRKKNDE